MLCVLSRLVGSNKVLFGLLAGSLLMGFNASWLAFLPRFVHSFLLSLKPESHEPPWGPLSLRTSRFSSSQSENECH